MEDSKANLKENKRNEKEEVGRKIEDPENSKDKPEKVKEDFEFKGHLYIYRDKDDDKKIYYYLFHRKKNNYNDYDLRCKDRNCKGTTSLENEDIFIIKTKCSLTYEQHNYVKEILAYNKIKNNTVTEEEMKLEFFKKAYFKINIETFPCIKYEDILYNLTNKFPNINKILFSKTKFFNL